MRLSDGVLDACRVAGIEVYFADRKVTKLWNGDRINGTPVNYGGWYWHRIHRQRVMETDDEGPFSSRSAALRNAYVKLQLRPPRKNP